MNEKIKKWIDKNEKYLIKRYKESKDITKRVYLHDIPEKFIKEVYEEFELSKLWYEDSI